MKDFVLSLALAFAALLPFEQPCLADCGFDLIVTNASSSEFTVTKISTATTPIYKKQWVGSQTLASGASHKFSFTVDSCPSSKQRITKVFYRSGGSAVYQDVETHASGETQTLN